MVYSKPELYVENFIPSVAVAACDREWNGQVDTSWSAQPITCKRKDQTTEYIFASGTTGCQHEPNALGFLTSEDQDGVEGTDPTTYTPAQISTALKYTIPDQEHASNVIVYDPGAWYVIWGNGSHYGPATAEIVKIMTSSF